MPLSLISIYSIAQFRDFVYWQYAQNSREKFVHIAQNGKFGACGRTRTAKRKKEDYSSNSFAIPPSPYRAALATQPLFAYAVRLSNYRTYALAVNENPFGACTIYAVVLVDDANASLEVVASRARNDFACGEVVSVVHSFHNIVLSSLGCYP